MEKIQRTATLLIPVLGVFAALYVVFVAGDTLRFAFFDPNAWYTSGWVHPEAPVPLWQRAIYAVVWILPVAFGLYAVCAALRVVLLMRTGTLFDDSVGLRMRQVGIGTSMSGLADFCANLVSPTILSLTNPNGAEPLSWYFDSEPAGLIVCGGGFYLIGWILTEARRLADENEGFI